MKKLHLIIISVISMIISFYLMFNYSLHECYKESSIYIWEKYVDQNNNFIIVYSSAIESIYYSPGVDISSSENKNMLKVCFIRASIDDEGKFVEYKGIVDRIEFADTLNDGTVKCISQFCYRVTIPLNKLKKKGICSDCFEIDIQ